MTTKKLKIQAISLLFSLGLFIICIATFFSVSFGWFAKNEHVTGNGMGVTANAPNIEISYSLDGDNFTLFKDSESFDLTALKEPGDTADVIFKFVNKGTTKVSIDFFGIDTPNIENDEVSSSVHEKTYLGTQIKVELSEKNGSPDSDNYNGILANYDSENDILTANKITLYDDSDVLEVNGELELTVKFTFIYEDFPQNEFINFDGVCARSFYYEFNIK